MDRRLHRADAEVCLLPIRRRTESLHRSFVCDDGNHFGAGDDRPEIPAGTDSRSSGVDLSGDVAKAKGWDQVGCQDAAWKMKFTKAERRERCPTQIKS